MTPRDAVLAAIRHEEVRPVPYTLAFEGDVVARRLDEHFGSSDWRSRLTNYMTVCGVVETVHAEKVDDVYTQDAYGIRWRHDRPKVVLEPTFTHYDWGGYHFPEPQVFLDEARKEAARQAFAAKAQTFRVANIGWGIFEHSWRIRGFEQALIDAALEPDFYQELLNKLTRNYLAFTEYAADLECDAIFYGDDWGYQNGVILGPERWRKLVKPCWARVYQAAHAQGRIVMSHCCGSVADIMDDIVEIGLDVLESVQPEADGMNPYELKRRYGRRIALWGGLGSQSLVPFGTPAQLQAEIARLASEMGRGGGYILAPAKPLQADTPLANALAILEAFTRQ